MSHPTHPGDPVKSLAAYLQAMERCRQFTLINIQPVWAPATGDVDGFIQDEVVRQFHDPRKDGDGGVRIRGMKSAWWYARKQSEGGVLPTMDDILALGVYIEPTVNSSTAFRYQNVYIGDNTGAPPGLINEMMTHLLIATPNVDRTLTGRDGPHANEYRDLWKNMREGYSRLDRHKVLLRKFAELTKEIVTPDDWYMCYEAIHPFGDGNGRSGKVLHNWLLNSLDQPILIDDYFGGGNP